LFKDHRKAALALTLSLVLSANTAVGQEIKINDTGSTESEPAETAIWPMAVSIDKSGRAFHLLWPEAVNGAPNESIAFNDVIRFERSRPYEGRTDELSMLIADGRRILICSGDDVTTHALLIPALTGLPVKDQDPGTGHILPVEEISNGPKVALGGADGSLAVSAVTEQQKIDRPTVSANEKGTSENALPGEGGGKLERSDIDSAIKAKMNQFRRCYQKELQRNPTLRGEISVRFVIDKDGSVKLVNIKNTSMQNPAVESCLASEIMRTRFSKPKGNGTVVVVYPFVFSPG